MTTTIEPPSQVHRQPHPRGELSPSVFSEVPGADAGALARSNLLPAHLLDGDEIVIVAVKPSLWFIVFLSARWVLAMALLITVSDWMGTQIPGLSPPMVVKVALAIAGARSGFALLQWVSRLYVLTNRRIIRLRGIFNVDVFECHLSKIQNTYLTMAWYERLAGLGSISFSTAGTNGVDAVWRHVNSPLELHEQVRTAINRARKNGNGL